MPANGLKLAGCLLVIAVAAVACAFCYFAHLTLQNPFLPRPSSEENTASSVVDGRKSYELGSTFYFLAVPLLLPWGFIFVCVSTGHLAKWT